MLVILVGFLVAIASTCAEKRLLECNESYIDDTKNIFDCTCLTSPFVNYGDAPECENITSGDNCKICCMTGYESPITPQCQCNESGNFSWIPERVTCKPTTKCINHFSYQWGREMAMVPIRNCNDDFYYGVTFDNERGLPFYTVYLFTERNKQNTGCPRSRWQRFPCRDEGFHKKQFVDYDLIEGEHDNPENNRVGFDPTHLASDVDISFTDDAQRSTFYYLNAVPQDSYVQQGPWKTRKEMIHDLFSESFDTDIRGGIVITGTCLDHYYYGEFENIIPKCIWKLACTRTNEGEWTVAAFYHENVLSHDETDQHNRNKEIEEIRNQSFLKTFLIPIDPAKLWIESMLYFEDNNVKDIIMQCMDARPIIPPTPWDPVGNDLFQFWNQTNQFQKFDV